MEQRRIPALLTAAVCAIFSISALPAAALAQSNQIQIREIEVVGNERIDSEAVREYITLQTGAVSRKEVTEQVKELFQTGFFEQVLANLQEDGVLQLEVTEKPIVRKVFITGNEEVDEEDLAEVFSFGDKRFLDRSTIYYLKRSATAFYQSKGFYEASFEHTVAPVGENQVDVTFTVDEGERFRVREVEFRGTDKVDEDELRDVVQTKEYKWWSSWLFGTGRLNEELLENDRALARQYFLDNGYLDATVSEPVIEVEDQDIFIRYDVSEGEPYSVGSIGAEGTLLEEGEAATIEGVELETGEQFRADTLREDVFAVTDKFTDRGYAFANVVPNTEIDPSQKTVDVIFEISQGEPVTVDRITIRGNTKTYDNVIRRELRIEEQELYSSSKIRRSQELLQRLGYFEEVDIATVPKEGRDDEVDLSVNVREAPTGTVSAGAGFSSAEGALFNVRLSENNAFGTGRRIVANADLGAERENFILSLQDRRVNDTYWSAGLDLLRTEREFTDFDRNLRGGSLTGGYPLREFFGEWAEDVTFALKYELLSIDIQDVDTNEAAQLVIDSEGTSNSSSITPRLIRNTINNPLNPTDGSRQMLEVELAGLGGNEEFYLFEASQQLYTPILESDWGDLVFSWRTRFGYGDSYDGDPFPLFRRYFPGGINSVRGFDARTLGPKDEKGAEFGGSKQLVNNLEIIFPLLTAAGIRGVAFYDLGEAFDDDESITFSELRQAWGFGIRWSSPLGPIRIEFGFPIDREEGEDSSVTLFSFGAPL